MFIEKYNRIDGLKLDHFLAELLQVERCFGRPLDLYRPPQLGHMTSGWERRPRRPLDVLGFVADDECFDLWLWCLELSFFSSESWAVSFECDLAAAAFDAVLCLSFRCLTLKEIRFFLL